MIEAALFPIPNCVSFPGTTVPLHVFEPRYRAMVKHCVEHKQLLAVCHTEKLIREAPREQSLQEKLNTNQATYKPHQIFSAGRCEIVQTLKDGRMAIQVHMQKRLQLLYEQQNLPFIIAACEYYEDLPLSAEQQLQATRTQEKIVTRLSAMLHNQDESPVLLNEAYWLELPADAFSFELFNLLKLPTGQAQQMLEMQDVNLRLQTVLDRLNNS